MDRERTIEDARSVCGDLRTLFEQPGGPDSLEEVERLCDIAHLVMDHPRCRSGMRDLRRYARFLLLGDHRRWNRGGIPGRVVLCDLILGLLRAIDICLESLALMERSARVRCDSKRARQNGEGAHVRTQRRPKRAIVARDAGAYSGLNR